MASQDPIVVSMALSFILLVLTFTALGVGQGLVPPSQDPFYQQPDNISSYEPGAVIRSRQVSNSLEPFIPLPVNVSIQSVHQYLYRTTDSLGDAVAAATTILVPYNADPSKLLSYQIAYDSANPDCSPSYTLRNGTAEGGLGGIVGSNSTLSIDTPFASVAPSAPGCSPLMRLCRLLPPSTKDGTSSHPTTKASKPNLSQA